MNVKGVIFDLDGVVVDTAKYHYSAWNRLAKELGFQLCDQDNEKLKGVSRMQSLEIVLQAGNICGLSQEQKEELAERKNSYYLQMIEQISPSEILPGIVEFLKQLKCKGCKTALGSASKSGGMILERLELLELFDGIIDGNSIKRAKPDPEVFQKAAESMQLPYEKCIVVEDAAAGIQAAHACGMKCIGVGDSEILHEADYIVENTSELLQIQF